MRFNSINSIYSFIENNIKIDQINTPSNLEISKLRQYSADAKADAIHCYEEIRGYLHEDKDILEVGGGIHYLTSFLNQKYNITSVEPGGFEKHADHLRQQILNKNKMNIHTSTLESFKTKKKFDLIFSMNVLEHTKDIKIHIKSCLNLLKDENSLLFIQCPNYTFPYEPHFYKWFIPFFPIFTFSNLRKKKLIKQFGEGVYTNTLKNLNFKCTYFKIKRLNLNIRFEKPIENILKRIETDNTFKNRLFQNGSIRIFYNIIKFLMLEKILIKIFPVFFSPYLIMKIKK